ncbi:MAG: 50S ribosomal protein L6 [Planctomycetota bacterium]
MSRLGKKPVPVPAAVQVTSQGQNISVKGPKGVLTLTVSDKIRFDYRAQDRQIVFERTEESREARCRHGLFRSLVNNMVIGVSEGYRKVLLIEGVGFKAILNGRKIEMSLGFADIKVVEVLEGVTVNLPNSTRVEVTGPDRQKVGQFAAMVRKLRPPDPYKGKGVMYEGEVIRRKAGKSFTGEGG